MTSRARAVETTDKSSVRLKHYRRHLISPQRSLTGTVFAAETAQWAEFASFSGWLVGASVALATIFAVRATSFRVLHAAILM